MSDPSLYLQAGGNSLVLQQTMTLVERAVSLNPLSATYLTEVTSHSHSDLYSSIIKHPSDNFIHIVSSLYTLYSWPTSSCCLAILEIV